MKGIYYPRYMTSFPWQSWSLLPEIPLFFPSTQCPVKKEVPKTYQHLSHSHKKITGWCSWYAFGTQINEALILDQAIKCRKQKKLCEYILIDDGWCSTGDWLQPNNEKFSRGIKRVQSKLAVQKFKTGLWMAPFFADINSKVAVQHPDWFIKNKNGKPKLGMSLVVGDQHLGLGKVMLDIRISEAKRYLYRCIKTMLNDWQVSLLKLDFLYAPYFYPGLENTQIPDALLQELFLYIKRICPDCYVMASGCPFEPVKYLTDSIRIGIDTTPVWFYSIPLLSKCHARYAVWLLDRKLSIFQEAGYDKYFNYDPDVIVTDSSRIWPEDSEKLTNIVNKSNVIFYGDTF